MLSPTLLSLSCLNLPADLPVSQQAQTIIEHIQKHPVVIVCGETGSGKTTQLAKLAYLAGFGRERAIIHTQPRRIAAVSVAERIAEETQSVLGEAVGYRVRFANKTQANTCIHVVTDGVLLAELEKDRWLRRYEVIIIDEAHERSLNIDFLLGCLRHILEKRKDLKVIITSATINTEAFSKHFRNAPVLNVEGRLHPIEIRHQALEEKNSEEEAEKTLKEPDVIAQAVLDLIHERHHPNASDILVFLAGEREIRDVESSLRKLNLRGTEVVPLYARLTMAEQSRVFHPGAARRVILSTNVAETSLTVPRIGFVLDAGTARVKRYRYRSKVEQLLVEPISQAAAQQRAGRCGRIAAGVCVRLYDKADFDKRPLQTDPEILRCSLASVILRMKAMKLGDIETFPWLTPPSGKAIADAYALLGDIHALDESGQLTALGRTLVNLPLDPHLSRMLVAARDKHCLAEMLVIVSFLSVDDVRVRPFGNEKQADTAHEIFADEQSEFMSILKIWQWLQTKKQNSPSKNQYYKALQAQFLSLKRVQEWFDVHRELADQLKKLDWRIPDINDFLKEPNSNSKSEGQQGGNERTTQTYLPGRRGVNEEANTVARLSWDWKTLYPALHRALLTGLMNSIGSRAPTDTLYNAPRGVKFQAWPGSYLHKKKSPWLLAAELVETSKLFGRWLAAIDPKWIEEELTHLIKTQLGEPHWEKKQGAAVAHQSGMINGLLVYQGRRVQLQRFDLAKAREIMIRDGLTARDWESSLHFWQHNEKLFRDIEKLEHQTRRQGVWIDEDVIEQFYDQHIPADVANTRDLEKWYRDEHKKNPQLLCLTREILLHQDKQEQAQQTSEKFPKTLPAGSDSFDLTYRFEPGAPDDGVSLMVPLAKLNLVPHTRCEWLVPGLLAEKVEALIKSLPQRYRRPILPVADYVQDFCGRNNSLASHQTPLIKALIQDIRQHKQVMLNESDFKQETLAPHLWMSFVVVDAHGAVLDRSRNFSQLRAKFADKAREVLQAGWQNTLHSQINRTTLLPASPAPLNVNLGTQGTVSSRTALAPSCPSDVKMESAPTQKPQFSTTWTFGVWQELLEIKHSSGILLGYAALKDVGEAVELTVFESEDEARRIHEQGLLRLYWLACKDTIKQLEKNIPSQKLAMLWTGMTGTFGLKDLGADDFTQMLLRSAFESAFIKRETSNQKHPQNETEFNQSLQQGRGRVGLILAEQVRLIENILTTAQSLTKKINAIKPLQNGAFFNDLKAQMAQLFEPMFLINGIRHGEQALGQLTHYPRYLKAVQMRVERAQNNQARDFQSQQEIAKLNQQWIKLKQQASASGTDVSRLYDLRWLIEELRVSLFAQELRTPMPVSVKRIEKWVEQWGR